MKKYLFLDFDGVMHIHGKMAFHRAQYFADCISSIDNLDIVFSTSWREYEKLDSLKEKLPKSIRDRCIGMTPILKDAVTHVRYREILLFNQERNISDKNWVALDDMKSLFPPNCPNLILVDAKVGFSKYDFKLLKEKLSC